MLNVLSPFPVFMENSSKFFLCVSAVIVAWIILGILIVGVPKMKRIDTCIPTDTVIRNGVRVSGCAPLAKPVNDY